VLKDVHSHTVTEECFDGDILFIVLSKLWPILTNWCLAIHVTSTKQLARQILQVKNNIQQIIHASAPRRLSIEGMNQLKINHWKDGLTGGMVAGY